MNLSKSVKAFITVLALVITLVVNTLSATLPLNGLTPADVSNMFPNRFVPDGFTFSIWSLIYLGLIAFTAYAVRTLLLKPAGHPGRERISRILPLFWATCLFNCTWLLAWHHLQITLSLGIMLLLLVSLVAIFGRLEEHRASPFRTDYWLVETPFIIYLGWITVATIANAAALLVHIGWDGSPLQPDTWSIIMMVIATGLGSYISWTYKRVAYPLVIAWALLGIYRGQHQADPAIGTWALGGAGFLCATGLITLSGLVGKRIKTS